MMAKIKLDEAQASAVAEQMAKTHLKALNERILHTKRAHDQAIKLVQDTKDENFGDLFAAIILDLPNGSNLPFRPHQVSVLLDEKGNPTELEFPDIDVSISPEPSA